MARELRAERLRHILDAIASVETLTAGAPPAALKAGHPSIHWRAIAGLGNVLRHDYPKVRDPRVWRIVTDDRAPLKAAVTAMLLEFDKSDPARD